MAYKELGAGGERLNAGDLNYLINSYKMKAHASFSNKITNLKDVVDGDRDILLKSKSGTIHFLFENIERKSYLNDGSTILTGEDWDEGNTVPDITSLELRALEDGAVISYTLRNLDTNRSIPVMIKKQNQDGFYVEYWYSYVMLTIDTTAGDPNAHYKLSNISYSGTSIVDTSLRISYGNTNVITSPNAVQNKDLDSNFTNVLGDAFRENTMLLFHTPNSKSTAKLRLDNLLTEQNIKSFKLAVVNDDSVNSGITNDSELGVEAFTELTHTVTPLTSTGRYLHELTYSYSTIPNDYQNSSYPAPYYEAWLIFSNAYTYYEGVILLPNSQAEFGYGFPNNLDDILDDTPLTNVLLSFMSKILEFSIYNYGPQNYTMTFTNSTDISFFNNIIPSKYSNDGIFNTWLTAAGAYYQLLDMLNFNDGQEISWDIRYIK